MDPLIACTLGLSSSDRFDPAVVAERIGLAMSQGGVAGEPWVWRSGAVAPHPDRRSIWTHRIDDQRTLDLEAVLVQMLDRIDTVREAFLKVRDEVAEDAWISLHVKVHDGGTPIGTISVASMARVVSLGLDLDLDLYCSHP